MNNHKHHHAPVDVAKAMQVGNSFLADNHNTTTSSSMNNNINTITVPDSSTSVDWLGNDFDEDMKLLLQEMLLSLPGISIHNFRDIIANVENISALSQMSESELSSLIGPVNAQKLFTFFNQKQ